MKHSRLTAIATLLFLGCSLGLSAASAQSLGDYARTVRKNKPDTASANHRYDNDNLPTNETLSVVGQTPDPKSATASGTAPAVDPAAAAAEQKKTADDWKKKLEAQQAKIDGLNHELDLEQREYRLKAAAFYADAGTRLRNAAQFDKDDTSYKSDVEQKQKSLDSARQELTDMQEEARKAGIAQKDKDSDADKSAGKSGDKDNEDKSNEKK